MSSKGFGSFLAVIATPIVKKVLVALGFGIAGYGAIITILNQALNSAKNAWSGLNGLPEALAIIQISGTNTAISIIAGALIARVGVSVRNFEIKIKKIKGIKNDFFIYWHAWGWKNGRDGRCFKSFM